MTHRLSVGDPAPVFTLPEARGGEMTLDPSAAAATVVVFTANGCPYALAWHDRIQQVARDYARRDVTVVQVVANDETGHPEDSLTSMRRRVDDGEIAGPYLRDADQEAVAAYGATATPEVFVLDRSGVVRYHGAPDADHDDPAQNARWIRDALDDVLARRPVRRPSTSPAGCSTKWRVELLWWEGCPSHERALELLNSTLAELHRGDVAVVRREVTTDEQAARLKFCGSPTFQVGRRDLFPGAAAPALTCRIYRGPGGRISPLPDPAELAIRLREALARPWDLPGWVDPRKEKIMTIKRGVSLYSFQEEYFLRTMSLEDCIVAAADIGARGIEIIPEQSIPGYPHLTDEFVQTWHGWMKTYGTTPVATDLFIDTKRYPDRWLTVEEQVASVRQDIDIAVRLGASLIRAIISTPPEVMEGAAPYAGEQGVRLLLEVHAPFHYAHPWVLQHLEVMDRVGSPALGFMPDMGTYVKRFPRVVSERALRDGARPRVVDIIARTYDDHGDVHGLMDLVNYMGGGPVEMGLARQATHYTWNDPKNMLEHMPRIGHIQAKFYEMTEDYTEFSIPYDEIIPVLVAGGYDGYLSSEYEGNRHIQDAYPVDSVEQVRRQHVMFERLLVQSA